MAATTSGTAVVTTPGDSRIRITRDFNAPRHLVFRTLTEPELIKRWWAGDHGEVTLAEVDLRGGGTWRYVLVTPSGFEVAFHGEYREIVPDELIVTTEVYEGVADDGTPPPVCTYRLTETGGRTSLVAAIDCAGRAQRDQIIESGMESGMQTSYDALERVAVSLR